MGSFSQYIDEFMYIEGNKEKKRKETVGRILKIDIIIVIY